jgi:hypothetical protein
MSVTFKYEPVLKDLPGLETAGEALSSPANLPALPLAETPVITSVRLPPFPQWFRQDQQRRVLGQVEKRLAGLELKYQNLFIPGPEVIWSLPALLDDCQSSPSPFSGIMAAQKEDYHLDLTWPVSGTAIISRPLIANAPLEAADGDYIMTLIIGPDEYQIQLTVSTAYGQVNSQISLLRQIAAAINRQQTKVLALVREDPLPLEAQAPYRLPESRVRLKIAALLPGLDFSLNDQQGDLAARYDLERPVSTGLAQYRNPGQKLSSPRQDARLEDIVGVLRQEGEHGLSLTTVPGPLPLIRDIDLFLRDYNDLLSYLDLNCDYLRPALKDRLISPQQDRSASLAGLDLAVNAQGYIRPGEQFISRLLTDFSSVHHYLLAGDKAWAPAFIAQTASLRQLGLDNYAAEAKEPRPEQARSRLRADLEEVKSNIVNAYY